MSRSTHVILVLMVAAVLAPAAAPAAHGPPPKAMGSYDVIVRGYVSGHGHAVVGANSVTVTARVKDEDGNRGNLVAPNLRIKDGRFRGTGTLMGQPVTLSGRIDAPDGEVVKVARITCTFTTADGQRGRVVGHRKGP